MINSKYNRYKWLIFLAPIWVAILASLSFFMANKISDRSNEHYPYIFIVCFLFLCTVLFLSKWISKNLLIRYKNGTLFSEVHWLEYVFLIFLIVAAIVLLVPAKKPFIYDNIIKPPNSLLDKEDFK